jgi:voltage-gated sodium channel
MEKQRDSSNPPVPWLIRACSVIFLPRVQHCILGVIIFNALILGMETSSFLRQGIGGILATLDAICLGIFVAEIFMKLVVLRFSFFSSGWNVFDFLVIAISFAPSSGPLAVLRALRVLRVLRLVTSLPRLRIIVESILHSLPSIAWIAGLLTIIFYIFSVLTTTLFGAAFPDWFGSIGRSMYSLFQVLTLESWSMGIVRPVMEQFPHAYLLFIPFILITTFIVLNVFIAIIVNSMNEVTEANKAIDAQTGSGEKTGGMKNLQTEIACLKDQIARLEQLLFVLAKWQERLRNDAPGAKTAD